MAGAMSLLLYLAVLSVSVTSVLLGLDWLATPPPAPVKHVQVARTTAPIVAPAKIAVKPAIKSQTVAVPPAATVAVATEAKPAPTPQVNHVNPVVAAGIASAAPVAPSTTAQADQSDSASIVPDEVAAVQPAAPAPRCDVQACTSAYVSFRVSDCTWQPYDGPRRFCDKGTPPPAASVMPDAATQAQAQAPAPRCNVQACSRAYYSFDAADCTYQPYEGSRQLCEK